MTSLQETVKGDSCRERLYSPGMTCQVTTGRQSSVVHHETHYHLLETGAARGRSLAFINDVAPASARGLASMTAGDAIDAANGACITSRLP
jgi:hypothetical protein